MSDSDKHQVSFDNLRRRAEEILEHRDVDTSDYPTDLFQVIEELKIYQTELEVQNEELKRAQQEIRSLEQEYEDLFEFAPCGYITLNAQQGTITRCNLSGASLLGIERSRLQSVGMSNFVSWESEDDYFRAIKRTKESCEQEQKELKLLRQDNTSLWVRADIKAISSQGETEPGQLRIAFMDISAQKRAEEELQESENLFRSLIEGSPDAIFVMTDLYFAYLNDAALHLFGADRKEQLLGISVLQYIPPSFRDIMRTHNRKLCVDKEEISLFEGVYRRMDGTEVPVEISGVPTVFNGLDGALIFARDITQRKKAREEKEELQKQLFQAQKMESIGRLAGGVAHDLNNMPVAIIGYGEVLLSDPDLGGKHRQKIELIHKAGTRSRDLVSQLLAFSRKQTLQIQNLDLNQLVEEFEQLLRKTLREDIRLDLDLCKAYPPVQADQSQLEQVILNLALNAQDAMPEGGTLTIQTRAEELEKHFSRKHLENPLEQYVVLTISDTGKGMDKDTLEKIFEPFFSTKTKDQGTGLGLSMVYGIVKQHQGEILVHSETGQGTEFDIFLPQSDKIREDEQEDLSREKVEPADKKTVLVVEDNEMARDLAVEVLQGEGYHVHYAANGREGLDLLDSHQGSLDLLLTDVIMPGMNGHDLYEEVLKTFPRVKVLYMSGYPENAIDQQKDPDTQAHFLPKPFSVQQLCSKVREVLSQEDG